MFEPQRTLKNSSPQQLNNSTINLNNIIEEAWKAYDDSRQTLSIIDISAMVSTNHVYQVKLSDGTSVIAKFSYFGKYDHFKEDHTIISVLSNNLPRPFDNFLARSLMKGDQLFVHRHVDKSELMDAWVVFYLPIRISKKMPRRLNEKQIGKLAEQAALFHKTCTNIRYTLPPSSKTMETDIVWLLGMLETETDRPELQKNKAEVQRQCQAFIKNRKALMNENFHKIPVFVDWNIGNFSVTPTGRLFSRWDYDWFRMSTRMMDFYFFSRVVSDIGDRTVFSYHIGPLMEERFILFLKKYHEVYPLSENEIRFLKEAYRFFILNYVIKDGRHFFHEIYATKLQREAFELHFPSIDRDFDAEKLLHALNF